MPAKPVAPLMLRLPSVKTGGALSTLALLLSVTVVVLPALSVAVAGILMLVPFRLV